MNPTQYQCATHVASRLLPASGKYAILEPFSFSFATQLARPVKRAEELVACVDEICVKIWRRVIVSSTNLRTVRSPVQPTRPLVRRTCCRAAVGQRAAHAGCARREQQRAHRAGLADAHRRLAHDARHCVNMAGRHAAAAMRLMQCVPVVGFGVWRGSGLAARTLSRRPSGRRRRIIQGGRQVLQHAQRVDRGQHI